MTLMSRWSSQEMVSEDPLLVGLSHRAASVELRERLAIPPRELPAALHALQTEVNIPEVSILSTCNRVELYVSSSTPSVAFDSVLDFLASRSRLAPETFQRSLYHLRGREAVAHLFRVTAGLDSMVLGETEITAQVKQAYQTAHAAGTTGPVLNRLFQHALRAAKEVRSRTAIGQGRASVGSVVVS